MDTKKCVYCKQFKNIDKFSKLTYAADGLQQACKDCNKASKIKKKNRPKISPPHLKICIICKFGKPPHEFNKDMSEIDCLKTICRNCISKRTAMYAELPCDTPNATKICSLCKVDKPSNFFTKHRKENDGLRKVCRPCDRARMLMKSYNMTVSRYQDMLKEQDGKCAICKNPQEFNNVNNKSGKVSPLSVDHCHKTGTVRGLLCDPCNRALGALRDDPKIAENAAIYIRFHKSVK